MSQIFSSVERERYHKLLVIDGHDGCHVYSKGKKYLDSISCLWNKNLGYNDEEITEAITNQIKVCGSLNPWISTTEINKSYAEALLRFAEYLDGNVYFSLSGSESIEVAIKATRKYHNLIEISQKRVAAYCRVSTDSEDQKNSYESQVKHYKEYISQRSDWQLVDIYADEGITGTQVGKRQDFQRLITDCLNGEIDYIVTKAIARFARNTLDTLKYVRMLKDKQIGVYFEEENIDTLTMDGELLLTILSSVAQQEVENISAHVKKGLKMKMQRGELVGGPRCLGYDFDWETRQITVNQEEAKIVRYIFDRYLEGIGGRVIARELEEMGVTSPRGNKSWAETTILGVIKNEKYKGDVLQGKTFTVDPISKRRLDNYGEEDQYYIKGNHEPIVTEEEFN